MSRAAQAVQRAVQELRKSPRRKTVAEDRLDDDEQLTDDAASGSGTEDVTDQLNDVGGAEAAATNNEGDAMASKQTGKKKGGTKKAAKKKTRKAAKPAAGPKTFEGIPDPADMRLARNGIEPIGAREVEFTFTNGYKTSFTPGDGVVKAGEVRDAFVAWLRARLGQTRER